jgi:hypothetical protein
MRVLLCALVLAVVPLSAHTVLPTAFPEVVAQSSLILRGRVTDVRAVRNPERGVESIATVAVAHVLKGGSSPFVSVHVPGGLIGRTRTIVSGAPTLREGDQAVFFLMRAADNGWHPIGLSMGVYRVRTDARTGVPIVNPPLVAGVTASSGPVVRGDARRQPYTVSEFESLVRLVMLTKTPSTPVRRSR